MATKLNLQSLLKVENPEIIIDGSELRPGELIEGELIQPIEGQLVLRRLGDRFVLQGNLRVKVRRNCAVCGKPYEERVRLHIDEEFVIGTPDYGDATEVELSSKDMDTFYAPDGLLDVDEVVRDHIITEMPSVPLCPEHRSKDRQKVVYNLGDVDEGVDPRWAELRKLLKGGAKDGRSEEKGDEKEGSQ